MQVRITRAIVRRSVRNVCQYVGSTKSEDGEAYCRSCIISDAVYDKLSPLNKQAFTVRTSGTGRVELYTTYTHKPNFLKTLGNNHSTKKIVDIFDTCVRNRRTQQDNIYRALASENLLKFDVADPNDGLPEVREVYKLVTPSLGCYAEDGNMQYEAGKWQTPSIANSKFFVFNTLEAAQEFGITQRMHIYRCLAINPVKAIARSAVGSTRGEFARWWSQYTPTKTAYDYSEDLDTFSVGGESILHCDAVKLLEKVGERN